MPIRDAVLGNVPPKPPPTPAKFSTLAQPPTAAAPPPHLLKLGVIMRGAEVRDLLGPAAFAGWRVDPNTKPGSPQVKALAAENRGS